MGLACASVGALAAGWASAGFAQTVTLNFPPAGIGYDQQIGASVQTRARPLFEQPGVDLNGFVVRPNLDQSFNYDSNPTAAQNATGSAVSRSAASVQAASTWSQNSVGAEAGVDHSDYFELRGAAYTDWNVGLQGGYDFAAGQVGAAYSHQSFHQLGATIGTVRSDTPVADQTDSAQLQGSFNLYRFDFSPAVSIDEYRYGTAMLGGLRLDQRYLDRNVFSAGVTGRYAELGVGGIVTVARFLDSNYLQGQPGQPSNDSRSAMLLTGLDYQARGPWRYTLLLGAEGSFFTAAQYPTRVTPIIEADVVWTPTGLTTVTGTLRRRIADALAAGTNGFVLNEADLQLDHELLPNVILHVHGDVQYAQYLQGGTQDDLGAGVSADWLLNRNLRVSVSYDFTRQSAASEVSGAGGPNAVDTTGYTHHVVGVTLHFGL